MDSTSPRFTDTNPIWVALKPASTQNGFTMKPIEASPSLKMSTKPITGRMCGRWSISMSAPNIGPCVSAGAVLGCPDLPLRAAA